jgi:hypothetical protein
MCPLRTPVVVNRLQMGIKWWHTPCNVHFATCAIGIPVGVNQLRMGTEWWHTMVAHHGERTFRNMNIPMTIRDTNLMLDPPITFGAVECGRSDDHMGLDYRATEYRAISGCQPPASNRPSMVPYASTHHATDAEDSTDELWGWSPREEPSSCYVPRQ